MQLYDWQTQALDSWQRNQCKGIVNVVTGAGKTVLAMSAIKYLMESLDDAQLKIKIIVPKTFLVRQWMRALRDFLRVRRSDIGVFMGSRKSDTNCKFMIYVINSARYSFARHMLEDIDNNVFIIADECHHYAAEENSKIFDFARLIPNYPQYYAMGLSATPYCDNYENILVPYLGREIYNLSFVQALEANIINKFSILNIGIEFTADERDTYDELSENLIIAMLRLKKHCPRLYMRNNNRFFSMLENIAKDHELKDARDLARSILNISYKRKEVVYLAYSRIKCVTDLVKLIGKNSKILIFGERIEMAEEIYRHLCSEFPNEAAICHSRMHKNISQTAMTNFDNSQIRILVSCRTLDEGLNVSDTDVGIVASSTSSTRQRIQRLGRILRKKSGDEQAYFYYLYVKDTMEETEVFKDITDRLANSINIIDLYYDEKLGRFSNSYYEQLANRAIARAKALAWSSDKLEELVKNFEYGIIRCDWWLPENICLERIDSADTKARRNYYIAMLFLIRERTL